MDAFGRFTCFLARQSELSTPTIPVNIQATAVTGLLNIDGRLIEESWLQAPVVNAFYRIEPRQGGHYRYKTTVQVLYDKKNLDLGVFCKDSLEILILSVSSLILMKSVL